jgi:hypothetical protein
MLYVSPNPLNVFLDTLSSSLQFPATLEHLRLDCGDHYVPMQLLELLVWTELDSLVINPLYACLRRVDIIIQLFAGRDADAESCNASQMQTILSQHLPLLASKNILTPGYKSSL